MHKEELIKKGDIVLFIGENVTDAFNNYNNPNDLSTGYVSFIVKEKNEKYSNTVNFINRGMSGASSVHILDWIDGFLSETKSDVVSVMLCFNDT